MFTRKTTMGEVMAYPALMTMAKFMLPQAPEGADAAGKEDGQQNQGPDPAQLMEITFEQLCGAVSPAWNPDSMAEGFNAIVGHINNGVPMVQEIYTEEEIAADATKARAGLLWFPAEKKGPFALVCAGGAYMSVASIVEAFPVAKRLNELGITAFVLQYRAGVRGAAPKSGEDIRRAITYIIENHERFNVEEDYAAFGFSAGGHLVSELGTVNQGYKAYGFPKPQMLGLCYPLVAFAQNNARNCADAQAGHGLSSGESMTNDEQMRQAVAMMFEGQVTDAVLDEFTPINHLDKDYPKTFIWQTKEDEQVPYEANALEIYKRLQALNVPCRLKAVEHGLHGLGLGEGSEAQGWLDEAVAYWIEK